MALRNLSLTERREGNRNQNRVPTHFSIEQIKEHFVESMESIKKQFEVADRLLSVESMRDQLNLIGVGFIPALVRAFPKDKEEESKRYGTKVIKDLFQRRNEIAHQNDRSHASAEQTPITKDFVERYINNIELLVNGIHEIMELKDRQNL